MTHAVRYLAALLILVSLGAGAYGLHSYRSMAQRVDKLEQTAKQYDELKQRFDDFSKEVAYRRDLDTTIRVNRGRITHALENASHEDPTVGSFLAAPLPDGLRDAYRKADKQRVPLPHRN